MLKIFVPSLAMPPRVGEDICPASSRHIIAYNGCMHGERREGKRGADGRKRAAKDDFVVVGAPRSGKEEGDQA